MTVAVATPFNMDEQAFLQTMDRLIERFDRYSSFRSAAPSPRLSGRSAEAGLFLPSAR